MAATASLCGCPHVITKFDHWLYDFADRKLTMAFITHRLHKADSRLGRDEARQFYNAVKEHIRNHDLGHVQSDGHRVSKWLTSNPNVDDLVNRLNLESESVSEFKTRTKGYREQLRLLTTRYEFQILKYHMRQDFQIKSYMFRRALKELRRRFHLKNEDDSSVLAYFYHVLRSMPYTLMSIPIAICEALLERKLTTTQLRMRDFAYKVTELTSGTGFDPKYKNICVTLNQINDDLDTPVDETWIDNHRDQLIWDFGLCLDRMPDGILYVYVRHRHRVEISNVQRLIHISRPRSPFKIRLGDIVDLNDQQLAGVTSFIEHPLTIVCGGAGTGKTKVVTGLIYLLERNRVEYACCSFTNKAVNQIRRQLKPGNYKLSTIHKLIYRKRVNIDVLIMDEASMTDATLLFQLFEVLPDDFRLILIGDYRQLPPIKLGKPLVSILKTERFRRRINVVELRHNYRVVSRPKSKLCHNLGLLVSLDPLIPTPKPVPFKSGRDFNYIDGFTYPDCRNCRAKVIDIRENRALIDDNVDYNKCWSRCRMRGLCHHLNHIDVKADEIIVIEPRNKYIHTLVNIMQRRFIDKANACVSVIQWQYEEKTNKGQRVKYYRRVNYYVGDLVLVRTRI